MPTIVAMSRKRTPGHARCIPGPGNGWSEKARWFEVCSSSRLEEAGALDGREKSCRRSFLSLRNPRRRVKYPPPGRHSQLRKQNAMAIPYRLKQNLYLGCRFFAIGWGGDEDADLRDT